MANHHQPTAADDNHVWLTTTTKAESWSLSCLVSEHVLMAAHPQEANTGAVKEIMTMNDQAEVINVEYLSVSSRGSVTADADQASTGRSSKRKRGNPWSEKEHRQFLQGLQVHGKGKWKKISRDFVKTRTPVQVASHAQKFFDRRNSLKPRKRKSINDITTLPASAETITPLHVYNHKNHSTNQLQPMFSQEHHIQHVFGNHSVPATDFVYACLAEQDNTMLPCYASYPPMLQTQPPLMWQRMSAAQGSVTYPNNAAPLTDQDLMMSQVRDYDHSHVGLSMMEEPQFHPYQSPFPIADPGLDHLSVPTLIDGDYIIDLSVLEELLPPL